MYKNAFKFAAAALLLGTSFLVTSCDKSSEVVEKPELKGIEFSVKPMELREWKAAGRITRATAKSEFERDINLTAGDMLYVEGIQYDENHNPIGNCLSNMYMPEGAGGKSAPFSGDVYAPEGTTLDDFEDITYYLVGVNDKRVKLLDVEGVDVKAIELPLGDNHIVSSFTEAIEKYSEIGFLAPKFTNEVKLQQNNSYFVFKVHFPVPGTFADIADIKVTFVRPDGTSQVVTTEENPTGFTLDDEEFLTVVAPCEIEDETEQIVDLRLMLNFKNGKNAEMGLRSQTEEGNTVEHGEVYVLEFEYNPGHSTSKYEGEENNPWE